LFNSPILNYLGIGGIIIRVNKEFRGKVRKGRFKKRFPAWEHRELKKFFKPQILPKFPKILTYFNYLFLFLGFPWLNLIWFPGILQPYLRKEGTSLF